MRWLGGRGRWAGDVVDAFGNALGQGLVDSMQGVDWSSAPDESAAESARLERSGNRYAAWPDQTDAESARLARQGDPYAYRPDQTGAESARLGRYETKARFLENATKVWAAEDAASAKAALAQQHRGADAYRRELAEAAQRAKWDAMQVGAWSGRTGTGGPVWHVGASTGASPVTSTYAGDITTGAPYDEFGLFTMPGSQPIWNTVVNPVAGSVGSIGPAMQEFKYGALESIRIDTELAAQGRDTSALYGNALKGAVLETMLPGSPQEGALMVGGGVVASKVLGVVSGALVSKFPVLGTSIGGAGNGAEPVVLDLFGGRTSQTPGAINVDIVAQEGVRASATRLPFGDGVADRVIASNPYIPGGNGMMDFLPEAARVLKPDGQLVVNSTVRNPFGVLPEADSLNSLGLRVVQDNGPLLSEFQNSVFRFTDGRVIPNTSVRSTILQKVGP